ncbi:shikimate dehydrogenase [Clostridium novyi A str. 4552]|uniref:Shikimate dehydrogenase (NADP(+)) n=1 Tax=Clostridium novyi A str. 4552 TaxID=1444289 RepID=A0A0A0IFR7_CLONO|nr:shikimate dehydrogenase [Clostridium novyi]KGM98430.1 shikimate dehydrogenase [Clostridium novyi A str. 4552]
MKELYGLIGEKLGHSFSPQIHSLIFEKLEVNGYYHLFEVDKSDVSGIIPGFKTFKVKGANVTIPYKVDIMKYLDDISEEAKNIGAVNTICFKEGKTEGYNTDYFGFGMMLNKFNIDVRNKNVVILGTGGASKAVRQYVLDNEAKEITFVTRNINDKKDDLKEFKVISYNDIKNLQNQDVVINCTPCGMYPKISKSPLSKEEVAKFSVVIDLIYNPKETLIMKYAKEQGIKAINGLYMLVGQAVKAEELWNDIKIQEHIIDSIYEHISKLV